MVKILVIIGLLSFSNIFFSQENYIEQGLLKGTATISPSTMLNRSVNNTYISGFLEYFIEENLSLRGETFQFVNGNSKTDGTNLFIKQCNRTYFGVFYHLNKNNWDQYIGFQPGIAIMKPLDSVQSDTKLLTCPSFAVHIGSTFYVWKYFNFFVDFAYVNSSFRGLTNGTQKTDELILSAGLGFQIQTKKSK